MIQNVPSLKMHILIVDKQRNPEVAWSVHASDTHGLREKHS